jgi:hypothetical protein
MALFRQRLILLACLASLQVPTNGFILPRLDAIRESRMQRHLSTTVTADEDTKTQGGESTRLTKAKLLLKQFTEEPAVVPGIPSPTTTSTSEVPDNVWSNGLLDGSDVVTRYAFRKGVKIAEPLVKYDPVAAEKILFRQPAKWYVFSCLCVIWMMINSS